MSRPDKEIARLRRWNYTTAPHSVRQDTGIVLEYIQRLEHELSGYKRRDNKEFHRSLRNQ